MRTHEIVGFLGDERTALGKEEKKKKNCAFLSESDRGLAESVGACAYWRRGVVL